MDEGEGRRFNCCMHCFELFPAQVLASHQAFCPDKPNSVPLEDECTNLIAVIGKGRSGKTTTVDSLIGEEGVDPNGELQNSFRSFTSPSKKYIFMERKGDIKNLISVLSLADIALLVIDCSKDFKADHRIQDFLEECSVAKALGVNQLICCFNKIDVVQFSEGYYNRLKDQAASYLSELGFQMSVIRFVPISAHEQENVTQRTPQLMWYKGFTLLKQLEEFAATSSKVNKGVRMVVHTSSDHELGSLGDITARVHSGWVKIGADLLFSPGSWESKLVSMRLNGEDLVKVTAGELADLVVKGPLDNVKRGCVISENPYPAKETLSFAARLLMVDTNTGFTPGPEQYTCIVHESEFHVVVSTISWPVNRKTGKTKQTTLKAGDFVIVHFAVLEPAVVEKESEFHSLGCITVHNKNTKTLLAIGVVTDVETELVDMLAKPTGSSSVKNLPRGPTASSYKKKKGKNKQR